MPNFSDSGMPFTSHSRTFRTDTTKNSSPERNTAPRATCHGTPIPCTTAKAKYALSPIPGASAIGKFAITPISIDPIAAARQVATKAAPGSMPAAAMIEGLTTMM